MRKLVSFTDKKTKKDKKAKIQDKDLEAAQGEASAPKLSFEERIVVSLPMYEKDTCPKVILAFFLHPLKYITCLLYTSDAADE